MVVQNARRPSTSMATVGSSSTSNSGSQTSATAKRTRWVWPPESFSVRRSAMSATPTSSIPAWTGPVGVLKDLASPCSWMLSPAAIDANLTGAGSQACREDELAGCLERGGDRAEHDRVLSELAFLDARLEWGELAQALFQSWTQQVR